LPTRESQLRALVARLVDAADNHVASGEPVEQFQALVRRELKPLTTREVSAVVAAMATSSASLAHQGVRASLARLVRPVRGENS